MNNLNQFHFIYDNMELYQFQMQSQFDWILFIAIFVFGILFLIGLFYFIRFLILLSIRNTMNGAIARKKKVLADLILMKDIQTELEKEIEEAVLKAAFHS